MRALLVGESPSRSGTGLLPFSGRPGGSGARLAALLDVDDLATVVDPVNLSGYPFSPLRAAIGANELLVGAPHDRYVLCGRLVVREFGLRNDLLEVVSVWGRRFLLFPHPSGVSRFWNDPARVEKAGRILRAFVETNR